MPNSLKAKYRVNNNLFVACYLEVVAATNEGLKAKVGLRVPGDTVIPVGTKLYVSDPKSRELPTGHKVFELYYVTVQGVEIEYGVPVQVCTPIAKEIRTNKRKHERRQTEFAVGLAEMAGMTLMAINGSSGGLCLVYQPSKVFVGMVLGGTYRLQLSHKERSAELPVKVAHLHYDWLTNQHQLGVQLLSVTPDEELLLNRLIDPNFKVDLKKVAMVDTDEARIRPDI